MRIFPIILLVSIWSHVNCQNYYIDASDSDAEATKLFESLEDDITNASTIQLDFTFKVSMPGHDDFSTEGNIVQKGSLYKINSESQDIFNNEQGVFTLLKEVNELQITDAEEETSLQPMNPLQMVQFYKSEEFVYGIVDEVKVAEGMQYTIDFKMLNPNSDYSKIKVTLVKKEEVELHKILVLNKDGSKVELEIQETTRNFSVDDAVFYFDENDFPNIQIEDLRF